MAQEKHTFSAAVDEVIRRSGRKDRLADIQAYINQAVRENSTKEYFDKDMVEDVLVAGTDNYVWTRPDHFRLMRTVEYPNDIFPKHRAPGKIQKSTDSNWTPYFYYQGATYWVFSGVSAGEDIKVAYYLHNRRLLYYTPDSVTRPAVYLIGTENDGFVEKWQYLQAGSYVDSLGDEALEEAARQKVSNWLIFDWYDLVVEGALSILFLNLGSNRASPTFAKYKDLQNSLRQNEPIGTLAY